jgi:hypothetical protein
VQLGLVRRDPVDHALVEVGGAKSPDPAREVDVVRIVNLREVVEASGQLREREAVVPAVVLDLQPTFLDVDVRRSVLAHRPELDEMRLGNVPHHRVDDVERSDDIVPLRVRRVLAARHRVRRRRLLGVVDDCIGLELAEGVVDEACVLGDVADRDEDLLAGCLLPHARAVAQRREGLERRAVDLRFPLPLGKVVDDEDVVTEL